jgi:NADH-quinone oxidoreductase subunit J
MNTLAATTTSTGEAFQFWVLGTIAVIGALCTILMRRAVHSALCLAGTMIILAVFYLANGAYFLGVVQIVVYTGAIMMLFLFVLMLVGRDATDSVIETLRGQKVVAILLGLGLAGLMGTRIYQATRNMAVVGLDEANKLHGGNVQGLAALIFTKYVFAFEVTSALLISAAVGAMILAHVERRRGDRIGQEAAMRERFLPGNYPGPKPGPGVFATSNSVATPAKLPDGSPAQRSISPILPIRELTAAEKADKPTLTGGHDQ